MSRFQTYAGQGTRRATVAWQTLNAQPSWITRITIAVFVIVIAIPAIAMLVFALVAASLVFLVLWGVARIARAFHRVFPADDGRENVRVIRPRNH